MGEIIEEEELIVNSKGGEKAYIDTNSVDIILRTIGPARPSRLRVPSPIKVRFSYLSNLRASFHFLYIYNSIFIYIIES